MIMLSLEHARAADGIDLALSASTVPPFSGAMAGVGEGMTGEGKSSFFSDWSQRVARARASQPNWSSALFTTTGLLENRLRFDVLKQHAGNSTSTTVLDGGKGLDLIVGDSTEVQLAMALYEMRTSRSGNGALSGFGDWPFLRIEERLASSPEDVEDYVLTAWLQVQAPTGIKPLTNDAWTFAPTLAFGKGWGHVDIQGTVAVALPMAHEDTLGHQMQTNIAFQYHAADVFWPEVEANWTYYPDGTRGGLNQLFVTLGLELGRFALDDDLRLTFGAGYQFAVAPSYRARPLTPAYDHAWLFTSRLNFQ
jgi:hypothetical protein